MGYFAHRMVTVVPTEGPQNRDDAPRPVECFKDKSLVVLLGEPGAGKTTLFEQLHNDETLFREVCGFLHEDISGSKPVQLFLDGLDEVLDPQTAIEKIISQVKKWGAPYPKLWISCRASDWKGSAYLNRLNKIHPEESGVVLNLNPLDDEGVLGLLKALFVSDPDTFLSQAKDNKIESVLSNPQMLRLLVKAVADKGWPKSRQELFELSCENLLREPNKMNRINKTQLKPSLDDLKRVSGKICATLLFSGAVGFSLDQEIWSEPFPCLDEDFGLSSDEILHARIASGRALFRPVLSREECLEPIHRSVSEYLAAKWISEQLSKGLSFRRVLNLFLGKTGEPVAALRGIFSWLAVFNLGVRDRLIELDPLGVAVGGDVQDFPWKDKCLILYGIQSRCGSSLDLLSIYPMGDVLKEVFDMQLLDYFLDELDLNRDDDQAQTFLFLLLLIFDKNNLEILTELPRFQDFLAALLKVVIEPCWFGVIRNRALKLWLKFIHPQKAVFLLDEIQSGNVKDETDELVGILLSQLYPRFLSPKEALVYLHLPKKSHFWGSYYLFWTVKFLQNELDDDLESVLDVLSHREDLFPSPCNFVNHMVAVLVGKLLCHSLEKYGDLITDEQLFSWLNIGRSRYEFLRFDKADWYSIQAWLSHPERYKRVLGICFKQSGVFIPTYCLKGVSIPSDLGLWHLNQLDRAIGEDRAKVHLFQALSSIWNQLGAEGLTFEDIQRRVKDHIDWQSWFDSFLYCDISQDHYLLAIQSKARKKEARVEEYTRTLDMLQHLSTIISGACEPRRLFVLANIWLGDYADVHGATPGDRFGNYYSSKQIYEAANLGFKACLNRKDLPSVSDIFALKIEGKEHFFCKPCLIGMSLLANEDISKIDELPLDVVLRMIAFRLASYDFWEELDHSRWFDHWVKRYPKEIAEVFIHYISSGLKVASSISHYELLRNEESSVLANLAVPIVLSKFPPKINSVHLEILKFLLVMFIERSMGDFKALLSQKLSLKSLDSAQKIYWLTAAMLVDPAQFENQLWGYINTNSKRVTYVLSFFKGLPTRFYDETKLSVFTLVRLIELSAPNAELHPEGTHWVSEAMHVGDQIRGFISALGGQNPDEGITEIDRLKTLPSLEKFSALLHSRQNELQILNRDHGVRFLELKEVVAVLSSQTPVNEKDLAVLVLDFLDEYSSRIHQDGFNYYEPFWNGDGSQSKDENSCRNELGRQLRSYLNQFEITIEVEKEAHFAGDKRADIQFSCGNLSLPMEIKKEGRKDLWTAMSDQLVKKYAFKGYGIYLVFWFGGKDLKGAKDGGKKPASPQDLQSRLAAMLSEEERSRIFVRVIDVIWPSKG